MAITRYKSTKRKQERWSIKDNSKTKSLQILNTRSKKPKDHSDNLENLVIIKSTKTKQKMVDKCAVKQSRWSLYTR